MLTPDPSRRAASAPRTRRQRIHTAAKVTTGLGITALLAVPVVVAATSDDAEGTDLDVRPVAATDTTPTTEASTTTSSTEAPTTTTTVPEPTPEESWQAWYSGLSPDDKLAFDLFSMDDAERAQWAAFISPPPPPPAPEPAPAPAPVPAPEPAPAPAGPPAPAVAAGSVWDQLAQCEANGNWHINTGNGYSGGLQFHPQTWTGFGGGEFAPQAYQATREQQIVVAQRVQAAQGWGAWPGCTSKLGIR